MILERGGWGERVCEWERELCCFTYLYILWLILVCALMWDRTSNLGVLGRCSNQLSYPARTLFSVKDSFKVTKKFSLDVIIPSTVCVPPTGKTVYICVCIVYLYSRLLFKKETYSLVFGYIMILETRTSVCHWGEWMKRSKCDFSLLFSFSLVPWTHSLAYSENTEEN